MFKKIVLVLFCLVFVASIAFAKDQLQTRTKTDDKAKRIMYISPDGRSVQADKVPSPFSALGAKQRDTLSDAQPYRGKKMANTPPTTEGFEDFIAS